ncbi:MAG: phosphotransferase [Verrucomicrobiales bacterium]|nr:phosphotransferase [Verrucomicrobiales bacterium]
MSKNEMHFGAGSCIEVSENALAAWLKRPVLGVERIGGGRNSRIFKLTLGDAPPLALKAYFRHPGDQRDRLGTEFGAFTFLWERGFRNVPQPVAADATRGWAAYQFIEGERIPPGGAGEGELAAALELVTQLRELSRDPASRRLGTASEAFFSVAEILDNIRSRLERLRAVEPVDEPSVALREFLQVEFSPALDAVSRWSGERLAAAGQALPQPLGESQRTLSPSDFGFHNALRRPGGQVIFLDFEYFGWDDPAKMISDFLLHPAMELSADLKRRFVAELLRRFSDWPWLGARVEAVYPLFGLKWCLILLNEFLPDALRRREFAAVTATERAALQWQQLARARRMFQQVRGEYESFPYRA